MLLHLIYHYLQIHDFVDFRNVWTSLQSEIFSKYGP